MNQAIFWNTYIRFWLEAYLELSLVSFIRLRSIDFGTQSDQFHSIFAICIMITLSAIFLYSIIYLQVHFTQLA